MFELKIENNEDLDLGRWVIRDRVLTGLNRDEKPQESDIRDEVMILNALIENMKGA